MPTQQQTFESPEVLHQRLLETMTEEEIRIRRRNTIELSYGAIKRARTQAIQEELVKRNIV